MRTCQNCGEVSPDTFRFCPACASSLEQVAQAPSREVRKTVTIVFSDLAGSTTIGERIDPESLGRLMSGYYERMRGVLERHGGTVEKMIGDAVMGVFGIPVLHEDDALRAVRAAVEMRAVLDELNDDLEGTWGVRLQARTGVNTGEVLAGEASGGFVTGGVAGDAVNTAARLEQAAGTGEIVIGGPTYALVRDAVDVETLEPLSLKGKEDPVAAFRVVGVSAGGGGTSKRRDSPMVGRDPQLAMLRASLDATIGDRACRLFTVLGPAGIGKSRLVEGFLAHDGKVRSLMGRCLSYGDGITFWPVVEVIRQAAGITDADDADSARDRIAAVVRDDDDGVLIARRVAALAGLESQGDGYEETFWAVRRFLEATAGDEPLAVVFDDMHWAEPLFLDLVESLVDRSHGAGILVVCLARPELLDARPGWSGGRPNAASILLEPLADVDAATVVANLLPGAEPDPALTARVVEAAGGNPLFLEETVGMLVDDGRLKREEGRWVATAEASAVAIPPTISALLAARLDRLPSGQRAVIDRASVAGKVFDADAVARLTPEGERPSVGSALAALAHKEFIVPAVSEFPGRAAYAFASQLVRDVAYGSTPKESRAGLHEAFADWLAEAAGQRAAEYEEILGYHFEQAFRYRSELPFVDQTRDLAHEAAAHLGAAGQRALLRLDTRAAVNLLSRAEALLGDEDPLGLELLPAQGRALVDAGEFERAADVIARAEVQAERSGDEGARCYAVLARLELDSLVEPDGWALAAEHKAREAIEVFQRLGDRRGEATAWGIVSDSFAIRCRSRDAAAAALEAAQCSQAAGERGGRHFYGPYAIAMLFGPTPVPEAIARCEEVLASDEVGRGPRSAVIWSLGGLHAMRGDFEKARALVLRSAEMDRDLGQELAAVMGPAEMLGRIEMLAGDPMASARVLREGYEKLERLGERNYLSTVAAMLAEAVCEVGDIEEALELTRISEETAAEDDVASQVLWRSARARAMMGGEPDSGEEAMHLADEAVTLVATTDYLSLHADALVSLARVAAEAGEEDRALGALTEAVERYEAKGNVVGVSRARGLQR